MWILSQTISYFDNNQTKDDEFLVIKCFLLQNMFGTCPYVKEAWEKDELEYIVYV